jgi:hypothetical protein
MSDQAPVTSPATEDITPGTSAGAAQPAPADTPEAITPLPPAPAAPDVPAVPDEPAAPTDALEKTVVEYIGAVRHRIGAEDWPTLQGAATAGAKLGFLAIAGKEMGREISEWRGRVDLLPQQLRAEIYGISRAIIDAEVKRRVAFLNW